MAELADAYLQEGNVPQARRLAKRAEAADQNEPFATYVLARIELTDSQVKGLILIYVDGLMVLADKQMRPLALNAVRHICKTSVPAMLGTGNIQELRFFGITESIFFTEN